MRRRRLRGNTRTHVYALNLQLNRRSCKPSHYQIMAGDTMSRIFPALALFARGSSRRLRRGASQAPPLAGARIGGPFALTDQNGKTVRDSDFAGKYRIVYFGYTYCPGRLPDRHGQDRPGDEAARQAGAARTAAEGRADLHHRRSGARHARGGQASSWRNFHDASSALTGSPPAIAAVDEAICGLFQEGSPRPRRRLYGRSYRDRLSDGPERQADRLAADRQGCGRRSPSKLEHWVR